MRRILAVQFEVAKHGAETDVPEEVFQAIASWVSDWYRKKGITIAFPSGGGNLSPRHTDDISVARSVFNGVSHSAVSWSYPGDYDGNVLWHSRCEIGHFGGTTEFSYQLLLESIQFYVAPVAFRLQRPRLISALLHDFECKNGDQNLSDQPSNLDVTDIPEFVKNRLRSGGRRLPIVIISRDSMTEQPLIDAHQLADRLAGIATVRVLENKWAGYALSSELGKTNSCYNGAVRLYWPGPSNGSYIYVPDRVRELGQRLIDDIFRQLAEISAFRFVPGPVTTDALSFLNNQRTVELDRLKRAAQDRGDYEELMKMADAENGQLKDTVAKLQEENADLRAGREALQANWEAMRLAVCGEDVGAAPPIVSEDVSPKSIEQAVEVAQTRFKTMEFLESAKTSAKDSPYGQPDRVYQAFLAMDEICQEWRRSRRESVAIGPFEQLFKDKGFQYKSRASQTSAGKWGAEYETFYGGRKVSIQPHLTIGKGGPLTCLSIHFYISETDQRFVVAHVGKHKTNTST